MSKPIPIIVAFRSQKRENCNLVVLLGYTVRLSQEYQDWECSLVIEYLSTMHKALRLVPNSLINGATGTTGCPISISFLSIT